MIPHEQLVIVGAGPAGCACAIRAAELGLKVLLIDEHPQSPASMIAERAADFILGQQLPPENAPFFQG